MGHSVPVVIHVELVPRLEVRVVVRYNDEPEFLTRRDRCPRPHAGRIVVDQCVKQGLVFNGPHTGGLHVDRDIVKQMCRLVNGVIPFVDVTRMDR